MFPGHPWENEEFGAAEHEWYLRRDYGVNVKFDVRLGPFLDFCRAHGHHSNQLFMKIVARLSTEFLPQWLPALNRRCYPARYPAGYLRPVRPGADMLEHLGVREKPDYFRERPIRDNWNPRVKYMARTHPRLSVWLARHFFAEREVRNGFTLMVSRNPLRNLGRPVVFYSSPCRTYTLNVPFGDNVYCVFGIPHSLSNINFCEPFLIKLRTWILDPEQIPAELLAKPYRPHTSPQV